MDVQSMLAQIQENHQASLHALSTQVHALRDTCDLQEKEIQLLRQTFARDNAKAVVERMLLRRQLEEARASASALSETVTLLNHEMQTKSMESDDVDQVTTSPQVDPQQQSAPTSPTLRTLPSHVERHIALAPCQATLPRAHGAGSGRFVLLYVSTLFGLDGERKGLSTDMTHSSSSCSRSSSTAYDMTSLPTPRSSGAYYDAQDSLDDVDGLLHDSASMAHHGEFYTEVESFLNRPSPSLGTIAKGAKSTENLLPALKAERSKLRGGGGSDQPRPDVPGSGYGRVEKGKKKKAAPLDLTLVQQAFAYANELRAQELQANDAADDSNDAIAQHLAKHGKQHQDRPSRSSSSSTSGTSQKQHKPATKPSKPKAGKKTSAIYGVPDKQQVKAKAGPDWDSCSKEVTTSGQNNSSMDPQLMQQLVSNFQNGTMLHELRQELAASQASMKESRQVLQGAAKTFFLKGGG
ncbi:hypothetical protein DYB30_006577 [Aphanomyces astaci]|uniref:Uncharacterized protein n=2 Tax=Aphanomyces astaci TaxID=112090 RepID=A0A397DLZ8_APHAT|nr:hypothetical protein DYB34_002123 [Aphanomyces astaci]RHY59347.1 hypothetical protein DYB38_000529 [Aphanomyces astaci]RHY67554.1 hypothetical protein DYB30_006577 [Aphanomyces astaci]